MPLRMPEVLICWTLFLAPAMAGQQLSVQQIVDKSVAVNHADFEAGTRFNWIETDKNAKGVKTYRVTMLYGTPYYRLTELNGQPLSASAEAEQAAKERRVIATRRNESAEQRRERIDKFEKERKRDNAMMQEMANAFDFTMVGVRKIHGYGVYVLKATPKSGYKPSSMETQVLTGMHGELWIDQNAFHWVKVTAQVIHPVSIEGFLAEVEPGTQFELDNRPVGDSGAWQPSHFSMRSNARVLHFFTRESNDDETYTDYKLVSASRDAAGQSSRP
ncbi:MAG: hypothetical protein JO340_02395 [Acidobacteriaceae bacterium]|nr:hypothetical protein [Acidobacteriaceae bacterium]